MQAFFEKNLVIFIHRRCKLNAFEFHIIKNQGNDFSLP